MKQIVKKYLIKILRKYQKQYYFLYVIAFDRNASLKNRLNRFKNKNNLVYVVKVKRGHVESLSCFRFMLDLIDLSKKNGIKIAISHDYDPDLFNVDNNNWTLLWRQPFGDVKEKYVFVPMPNFCITTQPYLLGEYNCDYWLEWKKVIDNNIIASKELIKRVEKYNDYLQKNTMTVSLREEFSLMQGYSKLFSNHPYDPSVLDAIEFVKEKIEEWHIDYIYLLAQYQDTYDLFEKAFPNKLLKYDRARQKKQDVNMEKVSNLEKLTSEEIRNLILQNCSKMGTTDNDNNLDYVADVIVSSKSDYLIGSKSGATIGSLCFNGGKFKDVYIFGDKNKSDLY